MFHVYVLRSLKSSKRYVGMTSQLVKEKLQEHNYSTNKWTRGHKPFELAYTERFDSKPEALRRERFFKTGDGRRVLDKVLSKGRFSPPESAAEKNLRGKFFPGSSVGRAARC